MFDLLWLVPTLPLAGFIVLALFANRLPRAAIGAIGAGSVGLSALLVLAMGAQFIQLPADQQVFSQTLWSWMQIGDFAVDIGLHLDSLSLLMMFVVTFVGFFIHLYSVEYMIDDEGYSRFFAYMNLFVASMLILVMADNLLLLYLGWEGVGLCSYLLIGFWYRDPANGSAARKAFIVTRIGDVLMAIGLFLLATNLGTLNIQEIMSKAETQWAVGSGLAVAATLLLLGGALGKSAQLPLQTWLPDAMAGPTPVSALIHAATMVTAGVYLIARTHVLYTLAPAVQLLVGAIGAATLLLAGFSALTQRDIKRVLAYSTISQIGYMFLALGVGAWSAAMFHFMTHAFFKALLFLGAGAVILAMHHEHDMFKMGGLWRRLPLTFWTFLIGSASLAALPLITAGFYSKDLILWQAWTHGGAGKVLWFLGLLGALITGIYTFRMVFVTFFGEAKMEVEHRPGWIIGVPLVVLAFFSIAGGFVELPHTLGHVTMFSNFMKSALPAGGEAHVSIGMEATLQVIAAVASLGGIVIAWLYYHARPQKTEQLTQAPIAAKLHRIWFEGWGFDWLYDRLFVRPLYLIARVGERDVMNIPFNVLGIASWGLHQLLSMTQSGRVRWYATGIAAGAIIIIGLAVFG